MSSRLIPPNPGDRCATASTMASVSVVARQMGNALMPPNSLKSIALPSITGSAASGPMSPRPSTAVPSVTMATVDPLIVSDHADFGSRWMARHTRATPGVYAMERSSRVFKGIRFSTAILPPRCIRNVRSETWRTSNCGAACTAAMIFCACASSAAETVTSRSFSFRSAETRSMPPRSPPALPMMPASSANMPGTDGSRTRMVKE